MTDGRAGITPSEDPYEFDWPDDAKEERAAEREAHAKRTAVRPAPLLLSAIVIGLGVVLAFMFAVTMVGGVVTVFVAFAAPVVIGGLIVALLPAVLLQRVTATWRRGLPELAFLVLGLVIGGGRTWLIMTLFQAPSSDIVRAATFMATAVAAGMYGARSWAESFRMAPRAVYSIAILIGVITVASIANYVLYAVR